MLAVLVALATAATTAQAGAGGNHAGGGAFGRPQAAPNVRADGVRLRATASPSPRSAVNRAMERLGVSGAYATHVANTLEKLHNGEGDALVQLNQVTASLAKRWRGQGYDVATVRNAFTEAAQQTNANPAQIRTLVDGLVQQMANPAAADAPQGLPAAATGAMFASPGFR